MAGRASLGTWARWSCVWSLRADDRAAAGANPCWSFSRENPISRDGLKRDLASIPRKIEMVRRDTSRRSYTSPTT